MSDKPSPEAQEKSILKAEKKAAELRVIQAKAAELEGKVSKAREKAEAEAQNSRGTFGTPTEPRKSMSTYLRNQNKFEVSIVSILDRKAAILIKICSTFITALIAFSEYIDEHVVSGNLLSIILTVGLTISLVLSILAAKPFVIKVAQMVKKKIHPYYPNLEENSFILRQNCTVQEYEAAMRKVVLSQDLQLGNQIRGNFVIAKINSRKSIMIDLAYSVFLATFVITGIIFLMVKLGVI